jgi:phosphoenolpyruvate---glycerone phosphotransferase subunit DhaL
MEAPMQRTLEAWLRLSQTRVHERAAELTALDQAIGDGDHGINLDRGFTAIVAALDAGLPPVDGPESAQAAAVLKSAGRALISTVGGASGPLYGTAFLKASAAIGASDGAPAAAFVAALEAAAAGVGTLGKSTTGEKTMLDALVPAAGAARQALDAGGDVDAVLRAARDAADAGVTATIPLVATKGRASYLGERSVGHADPGATSAALLLGALADAAATA